MNLDFDTICKSSEERFLSQNLPLLNYRQDILQYLLSNQCLILQADTGLGKTTQIPQYLFLHEYFAGYQIFCTQPRKLAAYCVSKRVNEEFRCSNIANSCLSHRDLQQIASTPIVYFSECAFLNYLLTEIYNESPLKTCRALMIDEVHERNVETDVILALVKKYVLPKRPDFKLIVTSATLQQQVLSSYLGCSAMTCPGSAYPVKEIFTKKYENYVVEAVNVTARVIQGKMAQGLCRETILVFLAGYDEINWARVLLQKRVSSEEVEVLLLYGHLDFKEQQEIINNQSRNIRVVLSTNIAESSLTVPGVTCVVDAGREKTVISTQYKDFRVKFITKMSAVQRKGRAGRTNPGTCYRIFTEEEYGEMEEFREAAILRSNIGLLALKFLHYGIFNIESVPLLDAPDAISIQETYRELFSLNMVELSEFNTHKITSIGRFVLDLDIMPMLGKFIYHSYKKYECGDEATMLSAMLLCVDFPYLRRESVEDEVDLRDKYLFSPGLVELGDLIGALFIFRQYYALMCENCVNQVSECHCMARRKAWTRKFFICEKKLKQALRTYQELISKLEEKFNSHVFYFSEEEWAEEKLLAELSLSNLHSETFTNMLASVCKKYLEFYHKYFESAIVSSFYLNFAQYRGDNIIDAGYLYIATSEIVVPHPCSQLSKLQYSNPPKYVMFFEVSVTTNLFMKYISPVSIEKVKSICARYLDSINFKEDFECLSGLIFQNIGPAYMRELLGNSGTKLYDLETELKKKGAFGMLILPDLMKNTIKIRLPQPYRKLGEELLRGVLNYKQKEVLRKNIVHVPYSKGMVLVISPGCVISEIIYSDETLVYKISDLKPYASYTEALTDIQNTFEFHQFNLVRRQGELTGIVYFKSQAQVQEAQDSLKQRPLLGKNGPILRMQAVEKSESQPCLKITVGLNPAQLKTMLSYYGESKYLNIKCFENNTVAYIRYTSTAATDNCLHYFNLWVQEEYNITAMVNKLKEGILLPKELLRIANNTQDGIGIINDYLDTLSHRFGCDLHISGSKVLRIYGDLHKYPEEAQDLVLDLVSYETVPVSSEIMKCLEKTPIFCDGDYISWNDWQEINRVCCTYLYYRTALAVYGIPGDRQYAVKIIQTILSDLLKQIFTAELSYTSMKEFRKIELFKKQHSAELQIEININRRKGCFTITGMKFFVQQAIDLLQFEQKPRSTDESCEICLENFQEPPVTLSLCGHRFHSVCLNLQIKNAILESGTSGFPINCVICAHPLTHNDCCKVLTYEELLNLFSASLIQFMSINSAFAHCENPDCDYVYNIEQTMIKGNSRKCCRCKGKYCMLCKKQVFGSAHEIRCEIESLKKFSMEDALWIEAHTTACPRCFVRIEKNKGCNHLVCPKCSCHFCFLCKEEIKNLSPVDHYIEVGRICYQKYMVD